MIQLLGFIVLINLIHKPRIAQNGIPINIYPQRIVQSFPKKVDVSNLTKAEIAAIFYVEYYNNIYLTNRKKTELVKSLEENINGNPNDPATTSSAEDPVLE